MFFFRTGRPVAVLALSLIAGVPEAQSQTSTARAEELVRQLRSTDPSVRGAARIELKAAPDSDALPVLLRALSTTRDTPVRVLLVDVLSVYHDARKIPTLVDLALEFRPAELERQLVELGAPAADALIRSVTCAVATRDVVYPSWVARVIDEMGGAGRPALLVGLRSPEECRQRAADEGLMRAYMLDASMVDSTEHAQAFLLVQSVRSGDSTIRGIAVRWIDSLPSPERPDYATLVEDMILGYRSATPASRRAIATMLARVPSARVLRFMNAAQNAPDQQIRAVARRYVADTRASKPVQPERRAEPRTSRAKIELADSLAFAEDDSTATPTLVRFLADRDPAVRAAAAKALGSLQAAPDAMNAHRDIRERDVEGSMPPLLMLLADSNVLVRIAAVRAVAQIVAGGYPLELDSTVSEGLLVVRSLAAFSRLLNDRDTSVVLAALEAMANVRHPTTAPTVVPFAQHPNVVIRATAVRTLSAVAGKEAPSATCPIVARLRDDDEGVRYLAAEGVATALESGLRCPDDEELLLAVFDDPKLRQFMYRPLAELKVARAIPKLIGAMTDVTPHGPYTVCWPCATIGAIGDTAAVDGLLPLLNNSNWIVVTGVLEALAKLNAVRVAPRIQSMLADSLAVVRVAAAHALRAMNRCEAMPDLRRLLSDEAMAARHAAAGAAEHCRDRSSVAPLLRLLASDEEIRPVTRALGAIGDSSAVEGLVHWLPRVRCSYRGPVAAALGQLRDGRAVEAMIAELTRAKTLEEGRCADLQIIEALGDIGDPRARTPLEAIVRSARRGFPDAAGDAAVEALRKLRSGDEARVGT